MSSLAEILHRITQMNSSSLADLVEESYYPQADSFGQTHGVSEHGMGWAVNPDHSVQIGGAGVSTHYAPEIGSVATTAQTIQQNGHLKVSGSSAHRTLSINNGPINPALIPPCDPLNAQSDNGTMTVRDLWKSARGGMVGMLELARKILPGLSKVRFAPVRALLTVPTEVSTEPSDTATPLDLVPAGVSRGPEGAVPGPYVIIPPHVHGTASGPTTGATWGPTIVGGTAVPLHGIEIEYLFGHNRSYRAAIANTASVYQSLLGGTE